MLQPLRAVRGFGGIPAAGIGPLAAQASVEFPSKVANFIAVGLLAAFFGIGRRVANFIALGLLAAYHGPKVANFIALGLLVAFQGIASQCRKFHCCGPSGCIL